MALNREDEVRHLNEADMHIADGERKVTGQTAILERLRADGLDTREAERLLANYEEVLATFREHRRAIVDTIRQIDAGLI